MNQQVSIGQTTLVNLDFAGQAGGAPETFVLVPPTGTATGGTLQAQDLAISADGKTATFNLPVGANILPCAGAWLYVNAPLGPNGERIYFQVLVDVVAAPATVPVNLPPVPLATPDVPLASPPVATAGPVPVPEPADPPAQAMQPLVVTITHETPTVITRLAADLGEGLASWPNVPLTIDNPGASLSHTARGEVPLPIPDFERGLGGMYLTALADGKPWARLDVLQLTEKGYSN